MAADSLVWFRPCVIHTLHDKHPAVLVLVLPLGQTLLHTLPGHRLLSSCTADVESSMLPLMMSETWP